MEKQVSKLRIAIFVGSSLCVPLPEGEGIYSKQSCVVTTPMLNHHQPARVQRATDPFLTLYPIKQGTIAPSGLTSVKPETLQHETANTSFVLDHNHDNDDV